MRALLLLAMLAPLLLSGCGRSYQTGTADTPTVEESDQSSDHIVPGPPPCASPDGTC
jgi:hypothetical protein